MSEHPAVRTSGAAHRTSRALRLRGGALRLALLALAVGFLLGVLAPKLFAADAGPARPSVHVVAQGESLWDLAARVAPGEDPRRFIWQLEKLNGVKGGRLLPGQTLILPE